MGNLLQSGGVAGLPASFSVDDTGALTLVNSSGTAIFSVSAAGVVTQAGGAPVSDEYVKPVITVANATGGATGAALTLKITRADGSAVTTARQLIIVGSSIQHAPFAPSSTLTFTSATVGSVEHGGAGYALIETNASGDFACTATNSADETLYFMACQAFSVQDVTKACTVIPGLQDSAAWS